jgi:hypothetical protein
MEYAEDFYKDPKVNMVNVVTEGIEVAKRNPMLLKRVRQMTIINPKITLKEVLSKLEEEMFSNINVNSVNSVISSTKAVMEEIRDLRSKNII